MSTKKIKTPQEVLKDINNEKSTYYFLVVDSQDKPNASVKYIYDQALELHNKGKKVVMLIEGNAGNPNHWLGSDYHVLKIKSATNVNGEIIMKPCDFLFIPEIFASVMRSTVNMGCKRVIICQNYDFALEVLKPDEHWLRDLNIKDVIVTNNVMAKWVEDTFIGIKTHVIPYKFDDVFEFTDSLRKPQVLIYGRKSSDIVNFTKEFILRYPLYNWITFKHISGIKPSELAKEMNESLGLVWLDEYSSFGTLPIEAIRCHLPVIGYEPKLTPEWLTSENGLWGYTKQELLHSLNNLISSFLEDNVDKHINFEKNADLTYETYQEDAFTLLLDNTYDKIVKSKIEDIEKYIETLNEGE